MESTKLVLKSYYGGRSCTIYEEKTIDNDVIVTPIASDVSPSYGDEIVKRVNCHDELVNTLNNLLTDIESMRTSINPYIYKNYKVASLLITKISQI